MDIHILDAAAVPPSEYCVNAEDYTEQGCFNATKSDSFVNSVFLRCAQSMKTDLRL